MEQKEVNDLILLVAFAPIVAFLLGVGGVSIPWDTLLLSVGLFVVIPLGAGILTRQAVIRHKGIDYFNQVFVKRFDRYTIGGLLLTLVILFSLMGRWVSISRHFELQEGGVVISDNAEPQPYTEWKILNGQLVLSADTFDIYALGPDSLFLENSRGIYGYKRQITN